MHKLFPILAIALAGCSGASGGLQTASTPAVSQSVQEARPTDWRPKVAAYIKANWKDPASIREAEIAAPVEEIVPAEYRSQFAPRWVVCLRLNAKNSYGGYTGRTMYHVLMRGNEVLSAQPADKMGKTCDAVKLEPFTEANGKA